ncbi:MAG: sugar phosphate isomerase/epimerase [Armatimonadetes bacterium]|nr:sugar phosphate isomerase/epimerase [Armatimonadota bacterium]
MRKTPLSAPLPESCLAVQLYTVRDFTRTEAGFADTLAKIAAIGYPAVQLSAVDAMNSGAVSAETARKMLDDHGLKCVATHRPWDELAERTDEAIAFHLTLGCPFVAIGALPGGYGGFGATGADNYRRFISDATPVIARLKEAGIRFGYHNHLFEFAPADLDGNRGTLWDIFAAEGGTDFCLELDLYWAWSAGADPAPLLTRNAGRVPVIHLKDIEIGADGKPGMGAVGEGNMPWDTILAACRAAQVEWYCVEQDVCPRDPFDCLASSFRYLTAQATNQGNNT